MVDVGERAPVSAYTGSAPYIFVSYAHADADSVFPDLGFLHSQGFRLWYDEGIDPGNEWPDEVARALEGASQFLVFISPSAIASSNVRNEINFALDSHKPFLAVHLVETQLSPGLKLRMGDIQALLRYRMGAESYRAKLVRALPASTEGDPPSAPDPGPAKTPVPEPEAYARLGLSVIDSTGVRTDLREFGIVYVEWGGGGLEHAFREGLILERGMAHQTIPWDSIRRVTFGTQGATVELRGGQSIGPVKPRTGRLVGRDELGLDCGLALSHIDTISVVPDAGVPELEALLRDLPELVRRSPPGGWTATATLVLQQHSVVVTLASFFDGAPRGSQTFEMPGPCRFEATRSGAVSFVAVHAKEHWNLGPYDPETARVLARAFTRLNHLAARR